MWNTISLFFSLPLKMIIFNRCKCTTNEELLYLRFSFFGFILISFSLNWDKGMHFQHYFFLTLFWTWHVSLICLLRLSFQASVRGIFPLFFFILSMKRSKKCNKDSLKLSQKLSLLDNWVIVMQLSKQVTTLFS